MLRNPSARSAQDQFRASGNTVNALCKRIHCRLDRQPDAGEHRCPQRDPQHHDQRPRAVPLHVAQTEPDKKFKEEEYFKSSIGILSEGLKAEKISIKVANHHLKYLIAKPIHSSQKVIREAKDMDSNQLNYNNPDMWGEIEVTLQPNYEFVMEMLKYNQWVKIVAPKSVVDYFKAHLNAIVKYYQ